MLALAIGIHNIPEGLVVAIPIYFATGSPWRALGWAAFSGVSEPIGALVGYLILANYFSDNMYAILFGVVAGMMVIVSIKELLTTARRYDPDDTIVTSSFVVGMGVMSLSSLLMGTKK